MSWKTQTIKFLIIFAAGWTLAAPAVHAADPFRLHAAQTLHDTGILKYLLPRFSLKTSVRIEPVEDPGEADVVLNNSGRGHPIFTGPGGTWHLDLTNTGNTSAARFADWILSDIGQRTVAAFQVDGQPIFSPPIEDTKEDATIVFEGDAVKGQTLAVQHCGRCHVVRDNDRMNAIGSTPSFFVLRTFPDWEIRFAAFYTLNPHPAFTQIEDVTDPFPINRPSPIIPVEMDLDDLDAILAYVSALEPADLGAPLIHQ